MFYSDCIKDFTKTCITQSFILVLYNFEIVWKYHPINLLSEFFAYQENIMYIEEIIGSLSTIPILKLFILFIIPFWGMIKNSKNIFQFDFRPIHSSFVVLFRSKKNDLSKFNLNDKEKSREGITSKLLHIWVSTVSNILIYKVIVHWGKVLCRVIVWLTLKYNSYNCLLFNFDNLFYHIDTKNNYNV